MYNVLKICDREWFNLQMIKWSSEVERPGPRSRNWEAAVLGAGAWVCSKSAVLSNSPHPGAWPTGTAQFCCFYKCLSERLGTQGKCNLIKKLKLRYHFGGGGTGIWLESEIGNEIREEIAPVKSVLVDRRSTDELAWELLCLRAPCWTVGGKREFRQVHNQ